MDLLKNKIKMLIGLSIQDILDKIYSYSFVGPLSWLIDIAPPSCLCCLLAFFVIILYPPC